MVDYVSGVKDCGIKVIIVGVGGVAYFLGMIVVFISLFVLGVLV